jgi:hypothetical protein
MLGRQPPDLCAATRDREGPFRAAAVRTPTAATHLPFATTTSNWRARQSGSTYRCRDLHCRSSLARSARRSARRVAVRCRDWRSACGSLRGFRGRKLDPLAWAGASSLVVPPRGQPSLFKIGRKRAQTCCGWCDKQSHMMTLADLNQLWPADHNATPWVATPDGSWTRMAGAGVNPDRLPPISLPHKQGRRNAPAGPINLATAFRDSLSH